MSRKQRIEQALGQLTPTELIVLDESNRHNVPPGAESHFNLTVVSAAFEGQNRVARQRSIYALLGEELKSGLHALTLTLKTPAERSLAAESLASPKCLGGSKAKPS